MRNRITSARMVLTISHFIRRDSTVNFHLHSEAEFPLPVSDFTNRAFATRLTPVDEFRRVFPCPETCWNHRAIASARPRTKSSTVSQDTSVRCANTTGTCVHTRLLGNFNLDEPKWLRVLRKQCLQENTQMLGQRARNRASHPHLGRCGWAPAQLAGVRPEAGALGQRCRS